MEGEFYIISRASDGYLGATGPYKTTEEAWADYESYGGSGGFIVRRAGVPGAEDELETYLHGALQDPAFRAAYETEGNP